jgi:hypothetical protein
MFPSSSIPLFLIGCFHEIQIERQGSQYENAQRDFRQKLESLIDQLGIRFIGEEAPASGESIACLVAGIRNLRYTNIDIPSECRKKIKHRLPSIFNDATLKWDDLLESDMYASAWNRVREYHMYQTAIEELERTAEASLLIVGELHVEPLVALGFPPPFLVSSFIFRST